MTRFGRHRMPHPRRARILDAWRDLILGWTPPPGAAVLRTDVVRRVGGFPIDFVTVDDQAVFIKVAAEGSLAFVPKVVLHHRMHSAQVRTHIHSELHDGVRNTYLETLSGDRRQRAARAIAIRQLEGEGWFAWRRNDRAVALRSYVRAARLDPTTLWSPLVGPRYWSLILRCVVGVIVGARATALLQRGVWTARRRLKRLPGFVESPLPFRPDAPTVPYDPGDGARPGRDPAGDQ